MISKVLVPVDGSQNSVRAAEHALKLMKMNRDMEMTILNVVSVPEDPEELLAFRFSGNGADNEKDLYKQSKMILDQVFTIFNKERLEVGLAIDKGDAGEKIATFAADGQYELIVMGLRGQSDQLDVDLGSVSLKVIRLVECPVTLVK